MGAAASRARRSILLTSTIVSLGVGPAAAQGTGPAPGPDPVPLTRPGRFHVGPFYLTPTLHIGSIGLDTNVFYTATDHQADITASGGPGLQAVLPLGGSGKFFMEGNLDYLYFVKTASQRKLRWDGNGGVDVLTSRTHFRLEESYADLFSRPSYEVDERIESTEEKTRLDLLRRLFGRISLRLLGSRGRYETEPGSDYLGNDLSATLTRNEYRAGGGLDYRVSVKTSFVVEGEKQWDRFPLLPARDADSDKVWGGFRTDATALISGHALVGVRWFRPLATPGYELRRTVADVDETWNISPKTRLGGQYGRDLDFTAYQTSGLTQTTFNEHYGARIEKDLGSQFDVKVFGRVTYMDSDGDVTLDLPDGSVVIAPIHNKTREVGIDIGYRFRPHFRVGVAASYVDRRSNIACFGIEGLMVGGTVQFLP
jgi:hypothetical protein